MFLKLFPIIIFTLWAVPIQSQEFTPSDALAHRYESISHEILRGIDRGVAFLISKQNQDGSWGNSLEPHVTAEILTAILRAPENTDEAAKQKAINWLLERQAEDGSFLSKENPTKNTAQVITSLIAARQAKLEPAIRKARQFLLSNQINQGKFAGAFSPRKINFFYQKQFPFLSEQLLSTSQQALEALAFSQSLDKNQKLNFDATQKFLSKIQLADSNKQLGAFPKNPTLNNFLPSEYSTAQGFLACHFAQIPNNSPTRINAWNWLIQHADFTRVSPNDAQDISLGTWIFTLTKALMFSGENNISFKSEEKINWRIGLAETLVSSQSPEGSWNSPLLSPVEETAQMILALEAIYYSIPN